VITPLVNTQTLGLLGSLYRDSPRVKRQETQPASRPLPPAMGHVFAIESSVAGVRCRGCGQAYAVHQHVQKPCPMPEESAMRSRQSGGRYAKRAKR